MCIRDSLNTEGFGDPIAKIDDINSSKKKRNSKNNTINNPYECEYCYRKTTPSNKARHLRNCTVRLAGSPGGSEKIIYISNDPKNKIKNPMKEIVVKENERVQQIPNRKKQRSVFFICGQAGSGKSYYANKLSLEYSSMFPKNPIYLFSLLTEDKSITCKHVKRIKLDEKFVNTEFSLTDFKDSLIIYDDVDTIQNKLIKGKLLHILDTLLQVGRHNSTSVIYISHLACKGKETSIILSESNSITIYPQTMGNKAIFYLLTEYFGLSRETVRKIKKLNSRWVTIVRTYPMVLLYEKGAIVLNNLDDD